MSAAYRVTVVDDHSLFAETLVISLGAEGFQAQCVVPLDDVSPGRLLRSIEQTHPDLVLLDLDLGVGRDGTSLVPALVSSGVTVAVVTGSTAAARQGEALASGAATVIHKSVPFGTIIEIVSRLRAGRSVMRRERRAELLQIHRESMASYREVRERFDQITRREAEVLGLLMAGHQVGEIARTRFVSESTVRTQVKSILAKLQVSSQLTAVGLAHKVGWKAPQAAGASESRTLRHPPGAPSGRRWPTAG
jgi:DNA-binding NarL/FixJ family response regulator